MRDEIAAGAGALPDAAEVLVLALVQGLTEFLPVSSSGHLVLMSAAMDLPDQGLLLPVALHLGTLVAVLVVYRRALLELLRGLVQGAPREALMVALGTLPAVVVGLTLHGFIGERFGAPRTAAYGLLATAAILFVSNRAARLRPGAPAAPRPPQVLTGTPGSVGPLDALLIGCGQAVAILPGVSRSGTTIAVGLLRGLAPADAARFSFLLSVPAILGAAVLEAAPLLDGEPPRISMVLVLWGVLLAALVGWASLRVLLAFLARGAFLWFALYCALLGSGYLLFT